MIENFIGVQFQARTITRSPRPAVPTEDRFPRPPQQHLQQQQQQHVKIIKSTK